MKAFEYVFPVLAAGPKPAEEGNILVVKDVFGTAFNIGGDFFLTAHHVVSEPSRHHDFRLGYAVERELHGTLILEIEALPEYDLAVVRCPLPGAKALRWGSEQLSLLENIQSLGYPYAMDPTREFFTLRAFKGHVVSLVTFTRLSSRPRCYELSFQAPRGLSGAPLWSVAPEPTVEGIVIGNQSTEMLVFSARERISEDRETIVERFEAMQTGIALQTGSVLDLEARILAGSVRSHLVKHGLL